MKYFLGVFHPRLRFLLIWKIKKDDGERERERVFGNFVLLEERR